MPLGLQSSSAQIWNMVHTDFPDWTMLAHPALRATLRLCVQGSEEWPHLKDPTKQLWLPRILGGPNWEQLGLGSQPESHDSESVRALSPLPPKLSRA